MDASLAVDPVVLIVAGLLLLAVLSAMLSERLPTPSALVFLALGMVVGVDGIGLITLDDQQLVQNVGVLALLVILFEGGLTTKPTDLRRAAVSGGLLATVGVLITAAITGTGAWLMLGVEPLTAAIFGAVVSSTDAAAVFSTLRTVYLPPRLAAVLKFESGANDPIAVALTIGLIEYARVQPSPSALVGFAAAQLLGGLAIGVVVGMSGAWLLRRVRLPAEGLYPVAALSLAGLAYGLAAVLGGSGFFAVYIAGLSIGGLVRRRRRGIRDFHQGLANASEIGLFLLLGLLVAPSQLPEVWVPGVVSALVLVLVARPVAVAVSMLFARLPLREQAVVSWGGLRGAVPIVLATFPITAGYPDGALIFNVVFFVVLLSTLVQGSTVGLLVRILGVRADRPAWRPVAEALPIEEVDIDIVEVGVTADLPIVGRRLEDTPLGPGMLMASIVRDEDVIVPRGSTRICDGDLLLIVVQQTEHSAEEVTAWARAEREDEGPTAPFPADPGSAPALRHPYPGDVDDRAPGGSAHAPPSDD